MATVAAAGTNWRTAFQLLDRFHDGQLVVINPDEAGSNRCGVYHPEIYVRRVLASDLEFVDFFPDAFLQDGWLFRKP